MSVFLWSSGVLGVVLGYSFVAGRVFRALDPPERCGGTRQSRGYSLMCSHPRNSIIADRSWCADCYDHTTARRLAWLWPLAPLVMLPKLVFALASDVEARPQIEEEREKVHR